MNKAILTIISAAAAIAQPAMATDHAAALDPYVGAEAKAEQPKQFTYLSDGESYAMLSADSRRIERFDIRTGKPAEVLLDLGNTRENSIDRIDGFTMSADDSKILVWYDAQYVYRRSFTAVYYTYDVRTRILRPLSGQFKRQQSPVMSPNGRMVAFVHDNNIYIRKLDYQTEVAVTTDGARNAIINGVPDWVYEEEFTTSCSMAWAPDDQNLCYLKYDESAVPTYSMMRYGGACDADQAYKYYPGTWEYKYPVAGEPNSKVSLHSYDVETRKTKDIDLPDTRIEYIPRITYGSNAETLLVCALNRDQNRLDIYGVNPKSTIAKSLYTEESKTWIPEYTYTGLAVQTDGFVVRSWQSGYAQLYKYSYGGALMRTITTAQYDVTDYYGCDAKGNHYYCAAAPTPLDRTVKRIDLKGNVTDVSAAAGTSSARFSPGCAYMMLSHNSSTQAPKYSINEASGKQLRVLCDNAAYSARVAARHHSREFFTFQTDGVTLNGYIIKPGDFNPGKKYPCIVNQYSGPESQSVLNAWSYDWQDYFASQGYVIVCVDGRGTGGRGRAFCDAVYMRLGELETADQVATAHYAAKLPYVAPDRIAIYGWSFGGYEALMCATAPASPFAAAVAIAPVTSWRLYDSIYTERFMRTPQQNEDGYRLGAPLGRVEGLECPLLMMYGTADDNVHPANSIEFVSALEGCGNFCDMLLFPNMNHSIYGCNSRAVVYAKMLAWLKKNM